MALFPDPYMCMHREDIILLANKVVQRSPRVWALLQMIKITVKYLPQSHIKIDVTMLQSGQ